MHQATVRQRLLQSTRGISKWKSMSMQGEYVRDVEHKGFTPLVQSMTGDKGREAATFYTNMMSQKQLKATLLSSDGIVEMLTFFCHRDSDHPSRMCIRGSTPSDICHSCYICPRDKCPMSEQIPVAIPFTFCFPVCVLYLQQSSCVLILLLACEIFCRGTTPKNLLWPRDHTMPRCPHNAQWPHCSHTATQWPHCNPVTTLQPRDHTATTCDHTATTCDHTATTLRPHCDHTATQWPHCDPMTTLRPRDPVTTPWPHRDLGRGC